MLGINAPCQAMAHHLTVIILLIMAGCTAPSLRVYEGQARPKSEISILKLGSSMNAASFLAGQSGYMCLSGIDGKDIPELNRYPNNYTRFELEPGPHRVRVHYFFKTIDSGVGKGYIRRHERPEKTITFTTKANHRYELVSGVTWDNSTWHVKVIDRNTDEVMWDDSNPVKAEPSLRPNRPSPPPPEQAKDIEGLGNALINTLHPAGSGKVLACYFAPDGKWIIATRGWTSQHTTNSIYSLDTGERINLEGCGPIGAHDLEFSPNGKLLALQYYAEDGTARVRICNMPGFAPKLDLSGSFRSIGLIRWMPDNRTLLIEEHGQYRSERKGVFTSWSSETGEKLSEFEKPLADIPGERFRDAKAVSADGRRMAVITETPDEKGVHHSSVSIMRTDSGSDTIPLKDTAFTPTLAFSPDDQQLAVVNGKIIQLWAVPEARLLHSLSGHLDTPNGLAFTPDGRTLISGSCDETVRFWDTATGQAQGVCSLSNAPITCLDLSRDGRVIAFGDEKGRVTLCNYERLHASAELP